MQCRNIPLPKNKRSLEKRMTPNGVLIVQHILTESKSSQETQPKCVVSQDAHTCSVKKQGAALGRNYMSAIAMKTKTSRGTKKPSGFN